MLRFENGLNLWVRWVLVQFHQEVDFLNNTAHYLTGLAKRNSYSGQTNGWPARYKLATIHLEIEYFLR
jgi:hypothetical protein